jgi:hypothetical protein
MALVLVKLLQDTMYDRSPLVRNAKHSVDEVTAQRWEDYGIAEICSKRMEKDKLQDEEAVNDIAYTKQLESMRIAQLRQECTKYGIQQSNTDTKDRLISKLLNQRQ